MDDHLHKKENGNHRARRKNVVRESNNWTIYWGFFSVLGSASGVSIAMAVQLQFVNWTADTVTIAFNFGPLGPLNPNPPMTAALPAQGGSVLIDLYLLSHAQTTVEISGQLCPLTIPGPTGVQVSNLTSPGTSTLLGQVLFTQTASVNVAGVYPVDSGGFIPPAQVLLTNFTSDSVTVTSVATAASGSQPAGTASATVAPGKSLLQTLPYGLGASLTCSGPSWQTPVPFAYGAPTPIALASNTTNSTTTAGAVYGTAIGSPSWDTNGVPTWPVALQFLGPTGAFAVTVNNVSAVDVAVAAAAGTTGSLVPTLWQTASGTTVVPSGQVATLLVTSQATALQFSESTTAAAGGAPVPTVAAVAVGSAGNAVFAGYVSSPYSAIGSSSQAGTPAVITGFMVNSLWWGPMAPNSIGAGNYVMVTDTAVAVISAVFPAVGAPGYFAGFVPDRFPELLYPSLDPATTATGFFPPTPLTTNNLIVPNLSGPLVFKQQAVPPGTSDTCPGDISGQWAPDDATAAKTTVVPNALMVGRPVQIVQQPGSTSWAPPTVPQGTVPLPAGIVKLTSTISTSTTNGVSVSYVTTVQVQVAAYSTVKTCLPSFVNDVCAAPLFQGCRPVVDYEQPQCLGYFQNMFAPLCSTACEGNTATCSTAGDSSVACACTAVTDMCSQNVEGMQNTPACACVNRSGPTPSTVPFLVGEPSGGSSGVGSSDDGSLTWDGSGKDGPPGGTTYQQYKAAYSAAAKNAPFPPALDTLSACWWPPCQSQYPGLKNPDDKKTCSAALVECFAAVNDIVTDPTSSVSVDVTQACSGAATDPNSLLGSSGSSSFPNYFPLQSKKKSNTMVYLIGAVVAVVLIAVIVGLVVWGRKKVKPVASAQVPRAPALSSEKPAVLSVTAPQAKPTGGRAVVYRALQW